MRTNERAGSVNRRDFLAGTGKTALGAAMVLGSGTLLVPTQGWGMELQRIKPETMATMVQMARDIYPHDRIADKYYAKAVKGFDEKSVDDDALHAMIEESRLDLDARAGKALLDRYGREAGGYLDLGWEAERVAVLEEIEDTEFFQAMRGSLVVGLYNQKAVWPLFGYEGASSEHGGYIDRGFNDIEWV